MSNENNSGDKNNSGKGNNGGKSSGSSQSSNANGGSYVKLQEHTKQGAETSKAIARPPKK